MKQIVVTTSLKDSQVRRVQLKVAYGYFSTIVQFWISLSGIVGSLMVSKGWSFSATGML